MKTPLILIDSFENISMADGIIRIELANLIEPNGDKPQTEKVGGIAVTVPGFLRVYDQMTKVRNRLIEQGVLKRNEPASPPAGAAPAALTAPKKAAAKDSKSK
jgi:hypothetical protein